MAPGGGPRSSSMTVRCSETNVPGIDGARERVRTVRVGEVRRVVVLRLLGDGARAERAPATDGGLIHSVRVTTSRSPCGSTIWGTSLDVSSLNSKVLLVLSAMLSGDIFLV